MLQGLGTNAKGAQNCAITPCLPVPAGPPGYQILNTIAGSAASLTSQVILNGYPAYICWAASATSVGTLVYHGAYEGDVALFDSSTGNDVTNGRTQVQTESTGSPAQLGVTMTRLGSYVVVTMGDMSVPSTGGQLDQSEYGRSSHLRQPGCWGSWPVLLRQSSSFGINERSTGDVVRVKAVG